MLRVNIRKKYKDFSLDVHFQSEEGVLALLGASGAGKSLTLRCIAGIETPDEGYIILDGKVLFDSRAGINLKPRERRVGYLFQNYALFPTKSVEQNIFLGIRPCDRGHARGMLRDILALTRLTGLEAKKPHQLSGGQQQRVALARILVNRPEVLLLDEPFSALDEFLKWDLAGEMEEILEHYSCSTILVTHDRKEVERLADRVCVLAGGRSEPVRETADLFAKPETLASAVLVGMRNFSELEERSGILFAVDWGCPIENREPGGHTLLEQPSRFVAAFHQEDAEICEPDEENKAENRAESSALYIHAAVEKAIAEAGRSRHLILSVGESAFARYPGIHVMERDSADRPLPARGSRVTIRVPSERIVFLLKKAW